MILYFSALANMLVLIFSVEAPHVGVKISKEVYISEFKRIWGNLRLGSGVGSTRPCPSSIGLIISLE
jgi:hypothetical protein